MSQKIDYAEEKFLRADPDMSDADRKRKEWKANPLGSVEKDRLSRRAQDLERSVSNGMPTHTEMWKPTPENIAKHRGWEKANTKDIHELKAIRRRLDPDNPNAGRIEHLRKQGEADKLGHFNSL